jgi:hypothetical protein
MTLIFSSEQRSLKITLAFLAIVFLYTFFAYHRWPAELQGGDPLGYYLHLPSSLLYHDVADYKKTMLAAHQHLDGIADPNESFSATDALPSGKRYIKWPVGEAFLVAPFFIAAHVFCLVTSAYPADGFSTPYQLLAGLAPIFYVLAALWLFFGVLRRYFSVEVSLITNLALALATNLFYCTTYNNLLAHGFIFALVALLIDRTIKFWDNPTKRNAAWVGFAVGMAIISRHQDGIVLLIPMLWGIVSWSTLKDRFLFVFKNLPVVLTMAAVILICLFPQALYYKVVSGNWWWYSYGTEVVDLKNPHLLEGLFGYRNGWLLYTPVMALAVLGIFRLPKYVPQSILPILAILPPHLWIVYSWWCWYYTNSFGARSMIELYPLLALPLAAFLETVWQLQWKWPKISIIVLLLFFSWLNIFQVWQLEHGIQLSPYETKAHYWEVFGKTEHTLGQLVTQEANETQPSEPLLFVRSIVGSDMEDSTAQGFQRSIVHLGKGAIRMDDQEYGALVWTDRGHMQDARPGDWIRVAVWGYTPKEGKCTDMTRLASMVAVLRDSKDEKIKYYQVPIANKIGNPDGDMYRTGEPGQWGEAAFFIHIPTDFPKDGSIRTYIWNPSREKIYVDDLSVELWR